MHANKKGGFQKFNTKLHPPISLTFDTVCFEWHQTNSQIIT